MNPGTVFRVAAMLQHELQIIELAIVERAGHRIRPDNLRAGVQQQPGAGGIATLDRMVQGFVVIRVRAGMEKELRHADVMRPSGGAIKSRRGDPGHRGSVHEASAWAPCSSSILAAASSFGSKLLSRIRSECVTAISGGMPRGPPGRLTQPGSLASAL